MRIATLSITLSALLVGAPAAVVAASTLKSTMHEWRADTRTIDEMLSGQATYDERPVRLALQAYVEDAGRIAAQANGNTAVARDFKHRFLAFQADAQAAEGDLGRRPALTADFSRLIKECKSCHDAFNS